MTTDSGADHGVVADRDPAQDAGAVADPDVVTDADVALVDPLLADRALDLDHAVIEVDHHRPVGDDALAADRDVLVAGDRAFLAEHRLRADLDDALVRPDLGAVADPGPAAEHHPGVAPDLETDVRADEAQTVGLQTSAPPQLEPQPADDQHDVARSQHVMLACEPQERQQSTAQRRRRQAGGDRLDRRLR